MENKFVTMYSLVAGFPEPGYHDAETGEPVLYDSEAAAWKSIAKDFVEQLQQFIDGDREFDHTDFECDEWVEPVTVDEIGIHTEDRTIYTFPKNK